MSMERQSTLKQNVTCMYEGLTYKQSQLGLNTTHRLLLPRLSTSYKLQHSDMIIYCIRVSKYKVTSDLITLHYICNSYSHPIIIQEI